MVAAVPQNDRWSLRSLRMTLVCHPEPQSGEGSRSRKYSKETDAFERASARLMQSLSSIGVELITVATNHKDLTPDWNFTHGAGIASCLTLLSGRYDYGLLGATYTYRFLDKTWGSHPLTDRFLSTGSFQIIHDAAGYGRATKLQTISEWPEAFRNLRVCWSALRKDENCGRCGKCVMTILSALYHGLPVPESFPDGISADTLIQLNDLDEEHTNLMDISLSVFRNSKVPEQLVRALERCVTYNKRRLYLESPAKSRIEASARRLTLQLHQLRGP